MRPKEKQQFALAGRERTGAGNWGKDGHEDVLSQGSNGLGQAMGAAMSGEGSPVCRVFSGGVSSLGCPPTIQRQTPGRWMTAAADFFGDADHCVV